MEYVRTELISLKSILSSQRTGFKDLSPMTHLYWGSVNSISWVARRQPRAGCLDLLLRDPKSLRRYEVEIQLGATDKSHIIRTIEYWDIERKRFPDVEHCAVILAEDITSRFLNVISLFNGQLPLIAIKMEARTFKDYITLNFTTVLDRVEIGGVGEALEQAPAPTDRPYWEERASPQMLALADRVLGLVHKVEPNAELRYNKHYIGLRCVAGLSTSSRSSRSANS